jgi:hypothetical protein
MGYTCSVCGEYHDQLMLDIRLGLPDDVFALSDEERERATERGEDWCILHTGDPRFFTRALLEIPVPELETYFGYGVWAELDEAGFDRIRALWDDPSGADEPPFAARLANELAPYEATTGLRVLLRLRDVDLLPSAELTDSGHDLVSDQRIGITAAQAQRLAATVAH